MERATRYSRKREAILNAIQSTDCHPSAEWVYQTLKPLSLIHISEPTRP